MGTAAPASPALLEPAGRAAVPAAQPRGRRDRYIDTLRAVAMVRVVTLHFFGWVFLPLIFPSMGVMFALAGSLMASSLDRRPPLQVISSRIRRILPSIWLLGAIMLPVMLASGWTSDDEGTPVGWSLGFWLLPLATPPASDWGIGYIIPLWYVRTFIWLALLSPALLWLFRRWPIQAMAAPLVVLGLYASGLLGQDGSRTDALMISLGTFTTCWLLGFALHDDRIRGLPARTTVALALALLASGLAWAHTHQLPESGWAIGPIPLANALYSIGAVLLILRFRPSMDWLARLPFLDKLITTMNTRALTIYIWGSIAIGSARYIERDFLAIHVYAIDSSAARSAIQYALTWVLVAVFVVAFGWVEDVGARRRIRVNPWPRTPSPRPRTADPAGTTVAG